MWPTLLLLLLTKVINIATNITNKCYATNIIKQVSSTL